MKKLCTFVLSLIIICCLCFATKTFAVDRGHTNIFKEGVYKVKSRGGDIEPGEYKFELITKDCVCYVYIINENQIQRYSKRFDYTDLDKSNSLFSVGTLLEGDVIIIYGNGSIYFNPINS